MTTGATLFDLPPSFQWLASETFFGLPASVWAAGAAFAIAGFILRYHRLGRALYAIGGISLDGGKGSMLGALSGVLLLGVVENLLTLAQAPSFWSQAIYGAIILASLMIARSMGGDRRE